MLAYCCLRFCFWSEHVCFQLLELLRTKKNIDLSRQVAKYQSQIDALEEEKVISPELAEQLEDQLLQISKKASRSDPSETWQALEQLEDRIKDEASIATQKLVEEGQNLSEIEQTAGDNANDANQLEKMQSLNDLIQKQLQEKHTFPRRDGK